MPACSPQVSRAGRNPQVPEPAALVASGADLRDGTRGGPVACPQACVELDMLAHGARLPMPNCQFHIYEGCVCVCVFQTCAFHNTFSLTRASLLGAEPCVDIWPPIEHRRVRNERTGRRDCKTGFCEQLQASTLQGLFCSYCQMLRCGLQVGSIHSGPVPCFHSFKVLFACTYRRCHLGKHCG